MTKKEFSFSKNERLKSRKDISEIFKSGKFTGSENLSLGYTFSHLNRFGVSVPKRFFKSAVVRNKIKRRIKEAYRKNKRILYGFSEERNIFFNVLAIYKTDKILSFYDIESEIVFLLKEIVKKETV